MKNPDPILQPESLHGRPEEPHPARVGFQEHEPGIEPDGGHRQTRQTPSGAEVGQEGLSRPVRRQQSAAQRGKALGVAQLGLEGTRTEIAGAASLGEDVIQHGSGMVGERVSLLDRGAGHRRGVSRRVR